MFAYVIFMVFRVDLCEKTHTSLDCIETGAISKYVSNITFLYEIYTEKHYFLH